MNTSSDMQGLEIFIPHVPFLSGTPMGNDFHQNKERERYGMEGRGI